MGHFTRVFLTISGLIIQCHLNLEKAISTVQWFLGDRICQSYTLEFSPFVKIKKKYCWIDQKVQSGLVQNGTGLVQVGTGLVQGWYRNLNELSGHPIPGLLRWH